MIAQAYNNKISRSSIKNQHQIITQEIILFKLSKVLLLVKDITNYRSVHKRLVGHSVGHPLLKYELLLIAVVTIF